jgi:large subunit ribosomal protein L22
MKENYPKNYDKENMARALGKSLPISFKQAIEICNFIRNRNIGYARDVLSRVIEHKQAIPFRRFNDNIGHKKSIMAGRYPKRASMEILNLINSVEANAQFKGLNTANLVITHITANKASKAMHFGRKRSRLSKRTNVEVIVQEKAAGKKPGKNGIKAEKKNLEEEGTVKKQDKKSKEKEKEMKLKEENKVKK